MVFPNRTTSARASRTRSPKFIAPDPGGGLSYCWWPYQRGLVRNTLQVYRCDVPITIPTGFDPVLRTKPYFRSTYVPVFRKDRKLDLKSLDDPALRGLKIGAHVGTPP